MKTLIIASFSALLFSSSIAIASDDAAIKAAKIMFKSVKPEITIKNNIKIFEHYLCRGRSESVANFKGILIGAQKDFGEDDPINLKLRYGNYPGPILHKIELSTTPLTAVTVGDSASNWRALFEKMSDSDPDGRYLNIYILRECQPRGWKRENWFYSEVKIDLKSGASRRFVF